MCNGAGENVDPAVMQEVAKMVAQSCSTCGKAMRAEGIKVLLAVAHVGSFPVEHLHEYFVMVWAVICLLHQPKAESLLRLFRHCLLRLNL